MRNIIFVVFSITFTFMAINAQAGCCELSIGGCVNASSENECPTGSTYYAGASCINGICGAIAATPTLSQWSLILLTLLLLSLSTIAILRQQYTMAQVGRNISSSHFILFDKATYLSTLPKMLPVLLLSFIGIWLGWGEITSLDVAGTLVSVGLVAYMLHLVQVYKIPK